MSEVMPIQNTRIETESATKPTNGSPSDTNNLKDQPVVHENGPENGKAEKEERAVPYWEYLQLSKLLDCDRLASAGYTNDRRKPGTVHAEHFFIVMHQVCELWFQQAIWDIDSARDKLMQPTLSEADLDIVIARLQLVLAILKLMMQQFGLLPTGLTVPDYLQFRGLLSNASGFQSLQFRLIENKLGQSREQRLLLNGEHYDVAFAKEKDMLDRVRLAEREPSLFELINNWLERCPFLSRKTTASMENGTNSIGEDFLKLYEASVSNITENSTNGTQKTTELVFGSLARKKVHTFAIVMQL